MSDDREPYAFEHPGLEFVMVNRRLAVRIGVQPRSTKDGPLFVGGWATDPFPIGWERVAKRWLAKNEPGVKR